MKKIKQIFWFCICTLIISSCHQENHTQLFDGQTFSGWEGSKNAFRIENNTIIGGSLNKGLDDSFYLCSNKEYSDFELTISVKLIHKELNGNAGISFRAKRIENSNRVASYQADIGYTDPHIVVRTSDHNPKDMNSPFSLWGCLIDECRLDTTRYPDPDWYPAIGLKFAERELIHKIVKPYDWNEMKVIAFGNDIEIKVNGITTVQFTEKDNVASKGSICLQAHSGDPYEIHYKNIRFKEL
ncbi:3-keto-disaccharide hydrolase [Psychroserpens sp. MEBiC05023]